MWNLKIVWCWYRPKNDCAPLIPNEKPSLLLMMLWLSLDVWYIHWHGDTWSFFFCRLSVSSRHHLAECLRDSFPSGFAWDLQFKSIMRFSIVDSARASLESSWKLNPSFEWISIDALRYFQSTGALLSMTVCYCLLISNQSVNWGLNHRNSFWTVSDLTGRDSTAKQQKLQHKSTLQCV